MWDQKALFRKASGGSFRQKAEMAIWKNSQAPISMTIVQKRGNEITCMVQPPQHLHFCSTRVEGSDISGIPCDDLIAYVLAAQRHHRHPAAGIHRTPDKIKVLIMFALLRMFKSFILPAVRQGAVDCTAVGAVHPPDVLRRPYIFCHDVLTEIIKAHALKLEQRPFCKLFIVCLCKRLVLDIWDVGEDFQVFMTRRRLVRIGDRKSVV